MEKSKLEFLNKDQGAYRCFMGDRFDVFLRRSLQKSIVRQGTPRGIKADLLAKANRNTFHHRFGSRTPLDWVQFNPRDKLYQANTWGLIYPFQLSMTVMLKLV